MIIPSRRAYQRRENIDTGIRWGLFYATVYSAVATVQRIIHGPEDFARITGGVSWLGAIIGYFLAGAIGGLLVGRLLHMGKSLGGSIVLGWVGAAPAFALYGAAALPHDSRFWRSLFLVTIIGALSLGSLCGAGLWYSRWRRGAA